jgi:diaminopimelate decarboxylase
MPYFQRKDKVLFAEGVSLQSIAEKVGTPCYIYSRQAIHDAYHDFYDPLSQSNQGFQLHYAVKANSNLAVLNILAKLGAGFDIVSGGELARVLKAGGKPENIVFSGVGKSARELRQAVTLGVGIINV